MMGCLYWHCHHDKLIEWCYDYKERVKYIRENKPENEIELRLKLFKPVKGKLPKEVKEAGQKCYEMCQKYDEACQKYKEAWQKYYEAWQEACQKYKEAWQKYYEAWQKYDEACQKYSKEIEELHKQECPDCSWDGKTIFPDG